MDMRFGKVPRSAIQENQMRGQWRLQNRRGQKSKLQIRAKVETEDPSSKKRELRAPTKAPAPQVEPPVKPAVPSTAPAMPSTIYRLSKFVTNVQDLIDDVARHGRRALTLPGSLENTRMSAKMGRRVRLQTQKPTILVLGSGWGAHSLIKVIDTDTFDVIVVSPRNHFLFTPMLPSTAVGSVEFRSLLEPIRISNQFVRYIQASCDSIDVQRKVAICTSVPAYETGERPQFEINYDLAVVAVGEAPATFGVPGVEKHVYFMKEISDCVGLRNRIGGCFELAALPGTSEEDRRRVLHFVVVGGGPTGVEFAGTLSDFLRNDLRRKFPDLISLVRVTLLQSGQAILTQFDSRLAGRALDNLKSSGVAVRLGVRVVAIDDKYIELKGGERMEYGVCVWSAGNAPRTIVNDLIAAIPEQASGGSSSTSTKLRVDSFMRVVGADDLLALGDCSAIEGRLLPATAQVAAQQGAYVAHVINRGYRMGRGGTGEPGPSKPKRSLVDLLSGKGAASVYRNSADGAVSIASISQSPASLDYYQFQFSFLSLGMMAYIGDDRALTQMEAGDVQLGLYGRFAYLLWKSVYITKQVSFRNRVLILFDWLKAQVFGRDLSLF